MALFNCYSTSSNIQTSITRNLPFCSIVSFQEKWSHLCCYHKQQLDNCLCPYKEWRTLSFFFLQTFVCCLPYMSAYVYICWELHKYKTRWQYGFAPTSSLITCFTHSTVHSNQLILSNIRWSIWPYWPFIIVAKVKIAAHCLKKNKKNSSHNPWFLFFP